MCWMGRCKRVCYAQGNGTIQGQRLYQLICQSKDVHEPAFSIQFLDEGAQVYSFTFGYAISRDTEPLWDLPRASGTRRAVSATIDPAMSSPPDPRVLFAAERTLLAWQRTSLALMGFGFVIERFSLFLSVLRREPQTPGHHLFSLLVGVALILLGSGVALASSSGYRRFVKSLPSQDVSSGFLIGLGSLINVIVAAAGIALAVYLLVGGLQVA